MRKQIKGVSPCRVSRPCRSISFSLNPVLGATSEPLCPTWMWRHTHRHAQVHAAKTPVAQTLAAEFSTSTKESRIAAFNVHSGSLLLEG